MNIMRKAMLIKTVTLISIVASTAGADVLLFKGADNASWTVAGSWTNVAGGAGRVPIYGDTANLTGSSIASVASASAMNVGATVNVSNSATLARSGSAYAGFAGILTFSDSSQMINSQLRLYSNAVFNWNSTGTWNGNGVNAQANFLAQLVDGNSGSGPTVNMSAGTWNLTGNSGAASFQLDVGTFNMTGGKIVCEDSFKLGTGSTSSRFNLGGTGEIWADSGVGMFSASVWNFDGASWAVYTPTNQNIKNYLTTKITTANIYNNGVAATNISFLIFSTVNVDGTDYTKVVAVAPPVRRLRLSIID